MSNIAKIMTQSIDWLDINGRKPEEKKEYYFRCDQTGRRSAFVFAMRIFDKETNQDHYLGTRGDLTDQLLSENGIYPTHYTD